MLAKIYYRALNQEVAAVEAFLRWQGIMWESRQDVGIVARESQGTGMMVVLFQGYIFTSFHSLYTYMQQNGLFISV